MREYLLRLSKNKFFDSLQQRASRMGCSLLFVQIPDRLLDPRGDLLHLGVKLL